MKILRIQLSFAPKGKPHEGRRHGPHSEAKNSKVNPEELNLLDDQLRWALYLEGWEVTNQ
jgi:hypothetical protein